MSERKIEITETEIDDTWSVARKDPSLLDLAEAILQTAIPGPLPRYGNYEGNSLVKVPHILGPATHEKVGIVEPGIGTGDRVIVWTTCEWPDGGISD